MRIAMLSVHSSPIAQLGGKEAGGMNVYVRELSRELKAGSRGTERVWQLDARSAHKSKTTT